MFGYVIADRQVMSREQVDRYKSYYCGICRALTRNHGVISSSMLSYDMAFLVLVLSSLYEPETGEGTERCLPHPIHAHTYAENIFTDYASDMTILLAYHKAMDDWNDEKKLPSRAAAAMLKSSYEAVAKKYPRQTDAVEAALKELSYMEKENICDIDAAARSFGDIMRQIFVFKEDNWQKTLGDMADYLGRFIYVLDAFVDLKGDIRHGRYNPLRPIRENGSTDEDIHGILTMLIGESAVNFEKLPLIENVDIMRNILYSGVWTKFRLGMSYKKENGGEYADDK